MSDDALEEPLVGGHTVVRHWGFVWDYNDDDGPGGFVSGQFLLRSDGALLRRYGGSRWNPRQGGTRWEYRPWEVIDGEAGTDVATVARKLQGQGYDLTKPGPGAIDRRTSGPFPGAPALAEKADDLA